MIDTTQVQVLAFKDVFKSEAPHYPSASISKALYKGVEMTEKELRQLNSMGFFVYEHVFRYMQHPVIRAQFER